MKRRRKRDRVEPLVGSEAFGHDEEGNPRGSQAFGEGDEENRLRGALLFGNDPDGNPTGSDAFGGSDGDTPLRGALVVGNDPAGNPTGSDAFGGSEGAAPLKGALLFGNDPEGAPRGALAVGNPSMARFQLLGSAAFGAAQDLPEKWVKDTIGYDFGGAILKKDVVSMSGIQRAPLDRVRRRILRVLERTLEMDVDRLRHGLDEHSIKWGRLKSAETTLDRELASLFQEAYRKAPGERLGIGHVWDILEIGERMHSFELRCAWDTRPITLEVGWGTEDLGKVIMRYHKAHAFFECVGTEQETLGFADTIEMRAEERIARIRTVKGETVGVLVLDSHVHADSTEEAEESPPEDLLQWSYRDNRGETLFLIKEERTRTDRFRARIEETGSALEVGRIEDRLDQGRVSMKIEIDLALPAVVVWGIGAMVADMVRLRRAGWPASAATDTETGGE